MIENFKKKINKRKKQALKGKIIERARAIAEQLGKPFTRDYAEDATDEGHRYEEGLLRVSNFKETVFGTHGFSGCEVNIVNVYYEGNEKFSSHNGKITSYNPGKWEIELSKLYGMILSEVNKDLMKDRSEREKRELRKRWGL